MYTTPNLTELNIQKRAIHLLMKGMENQHVHHAYLFYGEKGSGKLATALSFAKHLTCNSNDLKPCNTCTSCVKNLEIQHPDIHLYFPTNIKNGAADPKTVEEGIEFYKQNPFAEFKFSGNKSHFVETIRQIKSESKFPPHEAKRKIYILHEIEFMNEASSNAFLKLMEEPPDNTVILMTTSNINQILSTTQSRCQKLFFSKLNTNQLFNVAKNFYPEIQENDLSIKLSGGDISKVFELIQHDFSELRKDVVEFLRYSIISKPVQVTTLIDKLTKFKDKNVIIDFLNLISIWFQDTNVYSNQLDESLIINIDLKTELAKFSERFGKKDFLEIIDLLENAKSAIRGNVHASMVMANLSIEINTKLMN